MSNTIETTKKWLVFVKQENTAKQIQELMKQNMLQADIHTGDLTNAIPFVQQNEISKLLLIEIIDTSNAVQQINELADHCDEETRLICIGHNNDVNLYRNLIKSGVDDYFTLPIDNIALIECINNITKNNVHTQEDIKSNSMIAVIGSRGGLGTSTISASMSWILSKHFMATTCLLDLDIYNGISSLIFNKDPNQGLTQVLTNADRLDAVFLKRLAININDQLSVLSSEQGLDRDYFITDEDLIKLTKLVQNNFDYTVVDINYNNLYSKIMLSASSDIIIVCEFSISSIRDTAKILKLCKIKAPFAKIKIISIRNSSAKSAELTQPQFEDGIQRTIDFIIPFDRKATLESLNLGIVFANKFPSHPINKKLRELLSLITKSSINESNSTWFDKLKNWKL